MKYVILFLSITFSIITSTAQDTANWESTFGPNFRHIQAVQVLNNNHFIGAGGWESNDAISSIISSKNNGGEWYLRMDSVNAILHCNRSGS